MDNEGFMVRRASLMCPCARLFGYQRGIEDDNAKPKRICDRVASFVKNRFKNDFTSLFIRYPIYTERKAYEAGIDEAVDLSIIFTKDIVLTDREVHVIFSGLEISLQERVLRQVAWQNLTFLQKSFAALRKYDLVQTGRECIGDFGEEILIPTLRDTLSKTDYYKGYLLRRESREEIDLFTVQRKMEKQLHDCHSQQLKQVREFDEKRVGLEKFTIFKKYKDKKDGTAFFIPFYTKEEHPVEILKNRFCGIDVATATCIGSRPYMEDRNFSFGLEINGINIPVFGVADGHGGCAAAEFVRENFENYFKRRLKEMVLKYGVLNDLSLFNALKLTCFDLDNNFPSEEPGTTLCVSLIFGNHIYTANVGDSRAVLVTQDCAIQLSEDATCDTEKYRKKVEKRGGFCAFAPLGYEASELNSSLRVNGRVTPAGAIGDKSIIGKHGVCCVSPRPQITKFKIADRPSKLILTTDGLTDVANSNQIGDAIRMCLKQKIPIEEIARNLLSAGYHVDSGDNFTVSVIDIPGLAE
jgi:serine/threonine protein phosphatase PrpC